MFGGHSRSQACSGGYSCSQPYPGGILAAGHVGGAFLQPVMFGGGHSCSQACLGGIPVAGHVQGAFLQPGIFGGYSCSQAYLGGIPAASLGNYFLRNSHHISEKLWWQLVQNLGLELQPMFS